MAKTESTLKNMILSLVTISLVASLALGSIYNVTKEPIEMAAKAKQQNAIKEVLPEFDSIVAFKSMPATGKDSVALFTAFKGGQYIGTAVATYSNNGYNAEQIQLMMGILPDGSLKNISVIQQKETPGLGTKMAEPKFKDQFTGENPDQFIIKVKKDGGNVDAITAATVSSRAFCDAVQRGFDVYTKKGGDK